MNILTNPFRPGDLLEIDESGKIRRFKSDGPADAPYSPELTHIQVGNGVARFNPQVKAPLPKRISVYFFGGTLPPTGGIPVAYTGLPYEYEEE